MGIFVEKHKINKTHKYFKECDDLSFKSKNLYNSALYLERQNYFNFSKNSSGVTHHILDGKLVNDNYQEVFDGITLSGQTTDKQFLDFVILDKFFNKTNNADYRALPAKVCKQIIQQVSGAYSTVFSAIKDYTKNPHKYKARPKIPNYKDKIDGRNVVTFELKAINNINHKKGDYLLLSGTNIKVNFVNKNNGILKQIRIVPCLNSYNIECVYSLPDVVLEPLNEDKLNTYKAVGMDLGVKNLITISNNFDAKPLIINGGSVKSINKYANELIGKARKQLKKDKEGKQTTSTSKEIKRLFDKRSDKLDTELHCISKYIVNYLVDNDVKLCVIGYNKAWKQKVNLGTETNQHFVSIPYSELISKITYKALQFGIQVRLTEESYTSKCSFFDNETLCKHKVYVGKRTKRGLFITQQGVKINSDVNGAFNILKKVVGDFKADIGQAVSPSKCTVRYTL